MAERDRGWVTTMLATNSELDFGPGRATATPTDPRRERGKSPHRAALTDWRLNDGSVFSAWPLHALNYNAFGGGPTMVQSWLELVLRIPSQGSGPVF